MIINAHIFNRNWFRLNQRTLLFILNAPFVKHLTRELLDITHIVPPDLKIIKIGCNEFAYLNQYNEIEHIFFGKARLSNKFAYRLRHFVTIAHWFDMNIANPIIPQFNLGFDTADYYPDADPESTSVDGYTFADNGNWTTWAAFISGAGTGASDDGTILTQVKYTARAAPPNDRWTAIWRGFMLFDTSGLNDSASISDASINFLTLSTKNSGVGTFDLYVVPASPASNTALTSSDHLSFTRTDYGNETWSNLPASTWNRVSFNSSGIASISKTGVSKYCFLGSWDYNQSFGGTWLSAATSDLVTYSIDQGTYDPYLRVTYTIPVGYNSHTIL